MIFLATRPKASVSAVSWALTKLNAAREVPESETIVRQFIEERFGIAATSLAVADVISVLHSQKVKDSAIRGLQEYFEKAERTKFGGLDLPATEKARLINLATQIVETLDQVGEQV